MVSGNSWLDATGSGEVILAYCDMNTEGLELFLFTPLLKEKLLQLYFIYNGRSFYEMCLQGNIVVVFIILDWIFVLMNTTTMIPCRRVS